MIDGWFKQSASAYNAFIKALLFGDTDAMNTYINRVVAITFSYFDTGKDPSKETEPEHIYHGFVLGLVVELQDRYKITSKRERGFGRYDVVLEQKHRVRIGYLLRERRSMRSGRSGRIKEFR